MHVTKMRHKHDTQISLTEETVKLDSDSQMHFLAGINVNIKEQQKKNRWIDI